MTNIRPIDGNELLEQMKHRKDYVGRLSDPICLVQDAPTIDAVPVVRCKDCKHGQPMIYTHTERPCIMCSHLGSGFFARVFNPNWFCADGERRSE